MAKKRNCVRCGLAINGRRDARTCSARCRKAIQRLRASDASIPAKLVRDFQHQLTEPAQPVQVLGPNTQIVSAKRRFRIAGYFRMWLVVAIFGSLIFSAIAQALPIAQGYQTRETDLRPGMVVALTKDSTGQNRYVEKVNYDNSTRLVGVVVNRDDGLLAIANASSTVFVAASGQLPVLVSDINGAPKKGDLLSISPLMGVLMRASTPASGTFGVMLEDFLDSASQTVSVNDGNGQQISVKVAKTNINIDIRQAAGAEGSRGWLGNLGHTIVGRDISSWRVLAAMIIFATLLAVEGTIVHGVVSGSITALGRNPLAKDSIYWQSFRGALAAVTVLVVSVSVISLILWL